ncbi:imelysin family protein [Breoghania sp.]|uniref:imelysin family protein n=1 Tax=Breoghania sp. TaxID=2065378 RepID=UPI002AA5EEC3|nr:imelysin family protein [Breoghania sp.]
MRSFLAPLLVILALPSLSHAVEAEDTQSHGQFVANAVEGYIRPEFDRFAGTLRALDGEIETFCAAPDAAGYDRLAASYRGALQGFARIGFLRFGPLIEDHRLERLLFWPDRKSTGRRQVLAAVRERDESVLRVADLQEKSVAMQGLLALEEVLFDDARDALLAAGEEGRFRCGYATAIGENLTGIGDALAADWRDRKGYSALLLHPGQDNPAFRTDQEAASQILGGLTTGLQIVRDQWMRPVLGKGPGRPKPLMALFRRSGNSLAMMDAAVRGLKDYMAALRIKPMLEEEWVWMDDSLQFELQSALKVLGEIKPPLSSAVRKPEGYGKLQFVSGIIEDVRESAGSQLAIALKIQVGFNALDGD